MYNVCMNKHCITIWPGLRVGILFFFGGGGGGGGGIHEVGECTYYLAESVSWYSGEGGGGGGGRVKVSTKEMNVLTIWLSL